MRKTLSGKSLSDRKEALLHVRANHKLKPKEFYEKLHGPLRDLELSSKPSSYPKQIERLKKQAQIARSVSIAISLFRMSVYG